MQVKIKEMDHLGQGITFVDEKITFVPKTVPSDVCDIAISKEYAKYNKGVVRRIVSGSNYRVKEFCPYYEMCGGCQISNLSYEEQLKFKRNKVINIFQKYLNKSIFPEIISSDKIYYYRNKITFHIFNGKLSLVDINNNLFNLDSCLLVSERVNGLCRAICKEDLSRVKKIVINECDNGLILSIFGQMNTDNIQKLCLSIYENDQCLYYKEDGYFLINDIKYHLSNKSFFQINTANISKLYDVIVRYGNFTKRDRVIDLYCGVGSISLYIAKYVKCVLGIEIINEAVKDAVYNAKINDIKNVKFLCGDVSSLIGNNTDYDTIIVDPPRIGLDNHTVDILNISGCQKIIYVSCDPMTLVRDLKGLTNYELEDLTLVDMFPQTYHVECVSLLQKKNLEK